MSAVKISKIVTRPLLGVKVYRCDQPILDEEGVFTDFAEGRHGRAHATYDKTKKHRFTLGRHWGDGCSAVCFCMLNPSTADAFQLDPTVTRCYNFAKRWGADGMMVVNLFSLRTPSPVVMRKASTPNHELNDFALRQVAEIFGLVIAGWGNHGDFIGRAESVSRVFRELGTSVYALGTTNSNGTPKHPLYLPSNSGLFRLF
jgi:hypothetical protein